MAHSGYVVPRRLTSLSTELIKALSLPFMTAVFGPETRRVRHALVPNATFIELLHQSDDGFEPLSSHSTWTDTLPLAKALRSPVYELHATSRERRVFGWNAKGKRDEEWSSSKTRTELVLSDLITKTGIDLGAAGVRS